MNKSIIASMVLTVVLVISLMYNFSQSEKVKKLQKRVEVLSQQDLATSVATKFVKLTFQSNLKKSDQDQLKDIISSSLKKEIFEDDKHNHDLLEEEGMSQSPTIDKTNFNRINDTKASINFEVTLNYKGKDVKTSTKVDISTTVIKNDDVWKVDSYKMAYHGQNENTNKTPEHQEFQPQYPGQENNQSQQPQENGNQ
ncbi:hypothetical protein U0X36_26110 [Bacillus thuringiensis]|uniref:DUF4878 domain-containing protein n=1 Tax=Bacillus cereus (strain VD146) TaxID=1053236 RepID=R8MDT9_BACCX|nr:MULTISPECIES: hypothetical protein [Bacillus cereus group]EOP32301.1 hypothetical protein IK1_05837 [Bacillus cereus VD146]MDZ3956290.1 hypothetical protein [Bacillus thuringiensis]